MKDNEMNQRQQNEQQHATHPEPGEHSEHNSDNGVHDGNSSGHHEAKMYLRFGLMIATSTVVMFGLTYTNAFSADHVRFSEERVNRPGFRGGSVTWNQPRSGRVSEGSARA
ncbi:hypothetical protein QWY28_23195 [Nocardioides sp. SOB77]|uniref:Uncharacterized protein n=1 Tax=Nocardioides oceani TaxID=3058369 RepID=A0ABT8FMI3_9ACTN|nr:hypothetical protein [Nocardioides oceani]MDN4175878.1 hypothetical protein [Nocardioides oceani]